VAKKEIESVTAAARMRAGGATPGSTLTGGAKGRAADVAAKSVGWSRNTAAKAVGVVQAIDEARQKGNSSVAETIERILESRGPTVAQEALREMMRTYVWLPIMSEPARVLTREEYPGLPNSHMEEEAIDGRTDRMLKHNAALIPKKDELLEFWNEDRTHYAVVAPSVHSGFYYVCSLDGPDHFSGNYRPIVGWMIHRAFDQELLRPGTRVARYSEWPWSWNRMMFESAEADHADWYANKIAPYKKKPPGPPVLQA
jgi:hypothetical protein